MLKKFLSENIRTIDFFQAIRLLEKNNLIQKEDNGIFIFNTSNQGSFFWSIIQSLIINHEKINVKINISTLLTIKHAILLKNSITKKSFIYYFMNRFIWLYYDAFNKSHPILSCSDKSNEKDAFFFLLSLCDVYFDQTVDSLHSIGYRYAGALIHSRHSIEVLQNILADYFCMPCRIQLYSGKWLKTPHLKRHCLSSEKQNQQNMCLNRAFLGKYVFLSSREIKIIIEPYAEHYFSFLPTGNNFKKLVKFLKVYLPIKLNLMIKLKFYSKAIMDCRLYTNHKKYRYYLGWTVYLYPIEDYFICLKVFEDRSYM